MGDISDSSRSAKKPVVQARALETRSKILDQAEVAFARHGFDATSLTSDILDPAGVSVGSFYHQFENKTEVLLALVEERFSGRSSHVVELIMDPELSFTESVRRSIEALLDDVEESPDAWWVQFRERQHPDPTIGRAIELGWKAWSEIGRALIDRCYDASPERVDVAAKLAITVVSGVVREYLIAGDEGRALIRAGASEAAEFCTAGVERVIGVSRSAGSGAVAR